MLKTKTYTHIEGSELFRLCEKPGNHEVEGNFNVWFTPSQTCSILFWIPTEDELVDEVGNEEWMKTIIDVLLQNGFHYGDEVYIDIDY